MKKEMHLNNSATKDWSIPDLDRREQNLSDFFLLAGAATALIFLVSVTI